MSSYHKRVGAYVFGQRIGKGSFAEVYKGTHQTTNEEVAIKMITRQKSKEDEAMIEKEIKILKELNHTNIVRFLDYQKTTNHGYLIFEFCKHGDLNNFISENYKEGKIPEHEAQKLIQQIIEGIKAMKEKNIVHRDLKLANILVSKDFVLKIADFGLARYYEEDNTMLKTMVGTPLNMDPHILERRSYNEKCDIWSLGVIFYQILCGKPPYDPGRKAGLEDLIALIKKQPLTFPKELNLSNAFKDLISKMLVYDIDKRMNFEELFSHEWIVGKVKIEDEKQVGSDLEASQLLKSHYDQRRIEKKKEQIKSNIKEPEQVKPEVKKPVAQPVQVITQEQALALDNASPQDKKTELYGCVFLAKLYESLRKQIFDLKGRVELINCIQVPNSADDDPVLIVNALLLLQMLKIYKSIMCAKFSITDETSEQVIFQEEFSTLWKFIWNNKEHLENFYNNDSSSMDIVDLLADLKASFISTYESANAKINSVQGVFDKFKGHNLDQLLMQSLVHISEQVAYNEYLDENIELKKEKYKLCVELCDFYRYKKHFHLNKFRISRGREECKEMDFNEFTTAVNDNFKKEFTFKYAGAMSQRQDMKKLFSSCKLGLGICFINDESPTELDLAVEKLRDLIEKRIKDLSNS